ncbi:hypothetical protein CSC87_17095, partial [Staphylococcus aureus]
STTVEQHAAKDKVAPAVVNAKADIDNAAENIDVAHANTTNEATIADITRYAHVKPPANQAIAAQVQAQEQAIHANHDSTSAEKMSLLHI